MIDHSSNIGDAGPRTTARITARMVVRRAPLRRRGAGIGRARRWAAWARLLADRFRARRRPVAAAWLELQRRRGGFAVVVERIFEPSGAGNAIFSPRFHLTVAPLLRVVRTSRCPLTFRSGALATGTAGAEATSRAAPASPVGIGQHTAMRLPPAAPLERARSRTGIEAAPNDFVPALARRRLVAAQAASGPLTVSHRIAVRHGRRDAPPPSSQATYHRPQAPAPAPAMDVELASRFPRRHVRATPAVAVPAPTFASELLRGTPGELDRLTDQVVRRIDRRMAAWRERTGRVR